MASGSDTFCDTWICLNWLTSAVSATSSAVLTNADTCSWSVVNAVSTTKCTGISHTDP